MSFLNVDAVLSSSTSSSSYSPCSPRPNTASLQSLLASALANDQICRQLPPMSSASTLPDISAGIRVRARAQSPKRLSVFRNRSRSNTTTSTTSSYQSPASSMTSIDASSRRSSQDGRTLSSFFLPTEKESLAKSLISRGSRILKRQGSKVSLVAQSISDQEDEMASDNRRERSRSRHTSKDKEKLDGLGLFYRSHRPRHSDMHEFLKRNISDPFDFQHVTHTSPSQLPPIENTHLHDLATEFSIIRASQRPGSELKGIRAESLFYRNFSSEDLPSMNLSTLAPDSQSLYTRSPPHSPTSAEIPKSPKGFNNKRASRSVENFSRPVSRANRLPSAPTILPPPRVSSIAACARPIDPTSHTINALLGHESPPAISEHVPSPLEKQVYSPHISDMADIPDEIVHAFSTEECSPKSMRALPVDHVSGLANIPEENEMSWRNSRNGVAGCSQPLHLMPVDPAPGPDDLHSPVIPAQQAGFKQSPASANDQLGGSQPTVKIQHPLDDSWEDDIDYCYEHAAESNSNFDWQRVSFEEVEEKFAALSLSQSSALSSDSESPQKLCPMQSCGSAQENRSAPTTPEPGAAFSFPRPSSVSPSGSTNSFEIYPSPVRKLKRYKSEVFQNLGPPLEDRLSPLPMYGGMMPDIQESDEEVIYAQPDDQTPSNRSSCSPLSKCNSQESMILSRAASIVRKHRSSTSTNSVPDLVHSPNGSRETVYRDMTSPMVEQQTMPVVPRSPVSFAHTRGTSLARDVVYAAASSSSDAPRLEKPSMPAGAFHDRAKSESILNTFDMGMGIGMCYKAQGGFTTRKRSSTFSRGVNHRKTRTSYSLFPTTAPPTPPK